MGFFDKVKALKNTITGGAAKVTLEYDEFSLEEPVYFRVVAEIMDAPLKINRVYLKIVGEEEVELDDIDIEYDEDGDRISRRIETIRASNETLRMEFDLDGADKLEPNQVYEWEIEVQLPEDAKPIFYGKYCTHSYMALAGLDCFGNDPDSGWIELED